MTVAGRYREADPLTPTSAAKTALHAIARRWAAVDTEIRTLDRATKTILDTIAAPLLAPPRGRLRNLEAADGVAFGVPGGDAIRGECRASTGPPPTHQ
jgi:hypothetical protein